MPDGSDIRKFLIPIAPHVAAEICLPFPMTPADWEQMMAVLDAMEPAIVQHETQQQEVPGD